MTFISVKTVIKGRHTPNLKMISLIGSAAREILAENYIISNILIMILKNILNPDELISVVQFIYLTMKNGISLLTMLLWSIVRCGKMIFPTNHKCERACTY